MVCAICHDVLENATSLKECGHSFCNECIKLCLESTPSCPTCRVNVEGVSSCEPAFSCRELIDSMKIRCTNGRDTIQTLQSILGSMHNCGNDEESSKKRKRDDTSLSDNIEEKVGCDWTGTLKERQQHEGVCEHKIITCSVEGCNHTCKRKDMESHLTSGAGIMLHMDLKVKAMKDQLKSDMRVETNHMRYALDCRSWVEDNGGTDTTGVNVYQIRRETTSLVYCASLFRRLLSYPNVQNARNPKAKDCYTNEGLNRYRILAREENSSRYNFRDLMCPGEKDDEKDITWKWRVANDLQWSSASRLKRLSKIAS